MAPATNIIAVARLENVAFWASSKIGSDAFDVRAGCGEPLWAAGGWSVHHDPIPSCLNVGTREGVLSYRRYYATWIRAAVVDRPGTTRSTKHPSGTTSWTTGLEVESASRGRFNGLCRGAVLGEYRCPSFGHPIKLLVRSPSRPGHGVQL